MASDKDTNTGKANTIPQWDFKNQHVQNDLTPGEFVNACTTLICFGQPDMELTPKTNVAVAAAGKGGVFPGLSGSGSDAARFYPVGVTEQFNLSQNKQMQTLFEIGSYNYYTVPGVTITSATIARTFYNGASLLRCMYATYMGYDPSKVLFPVSSDSNLGYNDGTHFVDYGTNEMRVLEMPGYNGFWMNLASDVFDRPFGVLLLFMDTAKRVVGSVFLKNGYVMNHNMGVQAGALVVSESTQLQFEKVVPVKVSIQYDNVTDMFQ